MKPHCWDCKYFERLKMSAYCHGGKRITKLRQKDWYSGSVKFCTYFEPKVEERKMRLIDADALLAEYDRVHEGPPGGARKLIENALTIEPERTKGKWIEEDDGWDGVFWRCSECNEPFYLVDGTPVDNEYHYCPNCGADMRGERDG